MAITLETERPTETLAAGENRDVSVPWSIPFPPAAPSPPRGGIIDIRSSHACPLDSLPSAILSGLTQPPGRKTVPQLLLWDEKGQKLYENVLTADEYYPYRVERELLQSSVDEMATTIAASGPALLVELGAGNMSKISQLLASLDKRLRAPLVYYALDVDHALLERSLAELKERTNLRWITVCGLLGTYDDGARWLARPEMAAFPRTVIWLGTSIANCEQDDASNLLEAYVQDPETGAPQNLSGFLLLVDGCQDAGRISVAYDIPTGVTRQWVLHALEAARDQLRGCGGDSEVDRLLAGENWRFEGQWHPERQRYENYLVATRDIVGIIQGREVHIERGERVGLLGSGKWTEDTVSRIVSKPGLEVRKAWHHELVNYGAYWLQPTIRRHDSGIGMMDMAETPFSDELARN